MSTPLDIDELTADIELTRLHLAATVDALGDRLSVKREVAKRTDKAKRAVAEHRRGLQFGAGVVAAGVGVAGLLR
jgi:hypothetical protein